MLRYFGSAIRTVLAVALVMLVVALAPGVPTVLATATTTNDDARLSRPLAQQSCDAFETWFLDASCTQPHVKKVARTKKHLTRN
jgi:hypothetical protein